jgi:hypothetical protein
MNKNNFKFRTSLQMPNSSGVQENGKRFPQVIHNSHTPYPLVPSENIHYLVCHRGKTSIYSGYE